MDCYREPQLVVGSRVKVQGRGTGIIAMDNEDGTWNVELDELPNIDCDPDCDVPASQIILCDDQNIVPTFVVVMRKNNSPCQLLFHHNF